MELSFTEIIRVYGLLALFIIMLLENSILGPVIPGELVLFTASALAGQGVLNVYAVFAVSFVATVTGSIIGFFIGRKAGIPLLKRFSKKLHSEKLLEKSDEFFKKYGAVAIIFGRFVMGVRAFISLIAGTSGMKFGLFFLYTIIAAFVWTVLVTLLGFFFGRSIDVFVKIFGIAGAVILVIIILILIIIYLRKKRRERKSTNKPE